MSMRRSWITSLLMGAAAIVGLREQLPREQRNDLLPGAPEVTHRRGRQSTKRHRPDRIRKRREANKRARVARRVNRWRAKR